MKHLVEEGPNHSNVFNLKTVIIINILYPYDVHIPLIMGGGAHTGTEHAEHIQIIITSVQKADNMIPTEDRLLSNIQVRVIKIASNIRMYRYCVFCVRSGHNQLCFAEFYWERLSPSSTRKVKGRTSESE